MNPAEVAKHLPLIKMDIIEDTEDKGHIILYICDDVASAQYSENNKDDGFKAKFIEDFDSLELAFEGALYLYLHGQFDMKGDKKNLKCVTKHKITLKEFAHGRDGGSEWADPENDIDKRGSIDIEIFLNDKERYQEYHDGFSPRSPMYGISSAYITFTELVEKFLPGENEIKNIVAFEYQDRIFNDVYVMKDQLCISGKCVDPSYVGYEGNGTVKIDYFKSYVQFHHKNQIYIIGRNFYMNGEKIFDVDYLLSIFPNTNEFSMLQNGFYECEEVVKEIERSLPDATTISGDMFSMTINRKKEVPVQ
jgi:hypothetical protein